MQKFLMNGDIYVYTSVLSKLVALDEEVYQEYPDLFEGFNLEDVGRFFKLMQVLEKLTAENKVDYVPNYQENAGFKKLFITDENVLMVGKNKSYIVRDDEMLNNWYVNLWDFLEQSKFIGQYLEPQKLDLPRLMVLYQYDDFWIVRDVTTGTFDVGHKNSFNNYKLGDKTQEVYDLQEVYRAIINQEIKHGRSRN